MWESENTYRIKLGGNFYENVQHLLVYKQQSIFTITRSESTGALGIDFDIYDKKKVKIAVVKNGRIYSGKVENFIITVEADRWSLSKKNNGERYAK